MRALTFVAVLLAISASVGIAYAGRAAIDALAGVALDVRDGR